jgi:hypothetical protein
MHTALRVGALLAALLLTAGCDKGKSGGSGGPSASAAVPGPVTYKTGIAAYSGAYDGTKAVAYTSGEMSIFVPRDCPSFSCAYVKAGANLDKDKLKAACPKGQFMSINVKPPSAPGKIQASSITHSDATGGNGLLTDTKDVDVLSVGASIVARVSAKGDESVEGVVGATVCPAK